VRDKRKLKETVLERLAKFIRNKATRRFISIKEGDSLHICRPIPKTALCDF